METLFTIALRVELPGHALSPKDVCVTGMGPDNSRAAIARAIASYSPKRVVNLGAAGCLSDGFHRSNGARVPVGTIIAPSLVMMKDEPDLDLPDGNPEWHLVTVSEPVFGTNASGIHPGRSHCLVDMECYPQAQVCKAMGVPFHARKCVSDFASSQEEFFLNLPTVQARLEEEFHSWLRT